MASIKTFTVAQHAMYHIVKGVYTNKKDLYTAITNIENVARIEFKGVLQYENKKFNYLNLLNLLKICHVNDNFMLKIIFNDDKTKLLEVAVNKTNTIIEL